MAGSAVWLDVLPSMSKFASTMSKQAGTAAKAAGLSAGRQFSAGVAAGGSTSAAKTLVSELEVASKRAAKVVQAEKVAIAKARSEEKSAAVGVQAAEARLAEQRKKYAASSSQALKAEQQLTSARGKQQLAGMKVVAVEDQLKAAFNEQKAVTGQLSSAQGQASKQSALMTGRFSKLAAAGAPLSSGLGKVAAGAKNVAATALATLKPLAGMAAGFGAIIGAGQVIKLGNEYTATMNELQAVANLTGKQMIEVGRTARELGSDLTLPATSGKDAADIMLELAKGGLSARDAMEAAKGTIQLAAAAQVSGGRAAEIQANSLNQFGLAAKDAGMVADVLANTANAAAGGVDDIALSMKYVGPVANTLGVSISDTASAIGILANNGLKGDTAGTALRGMLASLARPSKQAQKAVDSLNLSVFDQQGKFVGLRSVIEQLSEAKKNMTQEDFAAQSVLAFGREPLAAVAALAKTGATNFDSMAGAVTRQGGAAAVAQSKMKGLGGAMDKLQSQLEDVALGIYQTVSPALEAAVNGIAGSLNGAGDKVQSFLNIAGGLGKLAFTGKVSAPISGIDPAVVSGVQTARTIIMGAFRDIWSFTTQSLIPSLKNIAVAVAPVAGLIAGVLVVAFRAAAAALRIVGPLLVGATAFLSDHRAILVVAAAAVGALVAAYWSMQIVPGIIGGVTAALTVGRRVQEGFALATYGSATALEAQGLAGKLGVAAFAARNAAMRVGAALTYTWTLATKGATTAMYLQRGAQVSAATTTGTLTAAQWAYNAALSANPIGLVVIAIVAIVAALAALVAGVVYAYKNWTWFRNGVNAVWTVIVAVAQWAWNTVLKPVFNAIGAAVRFVGAVFTWWWRNVTVPVFNGIVAVIRGAWSGVLSPIFQLIAAIVRYTVGAAFSWLYNSVIKPVWTGISTAVSWVWNTILSPIFTAIGTVVRTVLGPVFLWLYRNAIKPAWDGIKTAIKSVWDWLKPVFDKLANVAKNTIPSAFTTMKNGIAKAWEAVKTAAKAPIKFVVETVVNKALIGNFNKVAGFFGTKKIDPISLPKGFAGGGIIPGRSRMSDGDDHLRPMRQGEGVLVSEGLRTSADRSAFLAANAAGRRGVGFASLLQGGYAKGGVVGADGGNGNGLLSGAKAAWNWTKGAAGAAWDWTKNAAETASQVVSDPMGTLGKLVKSVIGNIPGAGGMVDAAAGMGNKLLSGAVSALKNMGGAAGDVGNFGGSGANGQLPKSALSKVSGFTGGPGVGPIGGYLRKAAAVAWEAMQRAFGGGLSLTEGYRDLANQQMRYSAYRAGRGNLAATPGTSVHGYGLAADVGGGSQAWMRANGPRFGWYPTGLSFAQREPWHFEYKGGKAAGGMAAGGIVGGLMPTLYDKGGVLPQGLSLVQNNLRDPEVALPMQTLREIVSTESGGGGNTYAPVFHNPDRGAVREFESWVHKKEVMAGGR